jgi:hypothetical protein
VLGKSDLKDVPQMWAMYKEVMGYFANGVPDDGGSGLEEEPG